MSHLGKFSHIIEVKKRNFCLEGVTHRFVTSSTFRSRKMRIYETYEPLTVFSHYPTLGEIERHEPISDEIGDAWYWIRHSPKSRQFVIIPSTYFQRLSGLENSFQCVESFLFTAADIMVIIGFRAPSTEYLIEKLAVSMPRDKIVACFDNTHASFFTKIYCVYIRWRFVLIFVSLNLLFIFFYWLLF